MWSPESGPGFVRDCAGVRRMPKKEGRAFSPPSLGQLKPAPSACDSEPQSFGDGMTVVPDHGPCPVGLPAVLEKRVHFRGRDTFG